MTTAIILHAPLRTARRVGEWQDRLLQALPYARRQQVTSRSEAAQRATLGGLALALIAAERLAGRPFPARAFAFPQDLKPRLDSGPFFSVSHTGSRVAAVASGTLDVGLDIEDCPLENDTANLQKLLRWTATEAVLKAHGLGLRNAGEVALDASLAFGHVRGERYLLQALQMAPNVIGHIAASTSVAWTIEEIELGGAAFSAALERSLGLPPQIP